MRTAEQLNEQLSVYPTRKQVQIASTSNLPGLLKFNKFNNFNNNNNNNNNN
jgi:hypothetical protein